MNNNSTSRSRRVPLCALVLVGVLLAAVHVPSCIETEPDVFKPRILPGGDVIPPPIPESDYSADIQRYNDEVAQALDRHLARIGELAAEFESGLRERGPGRFAAARAAIPGIRQSFDGFGVMSGVVKDGALDKAFGGDRLERRFNAALDAPFVRPCARAGASLVADFETFQAQLEAETAAFREEIGAAHGKLPEAVKAMAADMMKIANDVRWRPSRPPRSAARSPRRDSSRSGSGPRPSARRQLPPAHPWRTAPCPSATPSRSDSPSGRSPTSSTCRTSSRGRSPKA